MRIDAPFRIGLTAILALLAGAAPTGAQAPLFLVDPDTRVRSVDFAFTGGRTLDAVRLSTATALDGPGSLAGVRKALSFVPGIDEPGLEPFSPLVLQRDLARLRRLYRQAGFPSAGLDYQVKLDTAENVVDVTFLVDEGPAVTVGDAWVTSAHGEEPERWLPPELAGEWEDRPPVPDGALGQRYGRRQAAGLVTRTAAWFHDRGYPWAEATVAREDTTGARVDVTIEVDPGPRARIGTIELQGNSLLEPETVLREFPLQPGDWYDERQVADGEREIFGLDLVRRALAGIVEDQPRDTTVDLRIRMEEGRPRLIWGRTGYGSEIGLAAEAHWQHRNLLGGARTFTVSGLAETGWLSLERVPTRTFGASAAIRQPYVLHRRVSASLGPFASLTEGLKETSRRYGLDATLLYQAGLFRSVSLQYELSRRGVEDALLLLPLEELADARRTDPVFLKSAAKLVGSWGNLDDSRAPRDGYLVQPSLEVTTPGSEVEFLRLGVDVLGAVPLPGRTTLLVRGSAGRLIPFGASEPDRPAQIPEAFVGIRDVTFTAGGTSDVRGWGAGLLGPKVPDVETGPGGQAFAGGYVPVGGLARVTGGVELALPLPLLRGAHRWYTFLDNGRVWSPDGRFDPPDAELVQDGWFHATGAGLQVATPVGPVRVGVGYKLNPSPVDLLPADAVLEALLQGQPLSDLEPDSSRRWHLHLSMGVTL